MRPSRRPPAQNGLHGQTLCSPSPHRRGGDRQGTAAARSCSPRRPQRDHGLCGPRGRGREPGPTDVPTHAGRPARSRSLSERLLPPSSSSGGLPPVLTRPRPGKSAPRTLQRQGVGEQPSPLLTFVPTLESGTFPGVDLPLGVFPTWLPTGFAPWVWGGGAWPSAAPHHAGGGAP